MTSDENETETEPHDDLPREWLEEWTVPEMPTDMKERVMAQMHSNMQEQWNLGLPAAPAVAPKNRTATLALVAATVALVASAAAVLVTMRPREVEPQQQAQPQPPAHPQLSRPLDAAPAAVVADPPPGGPTIEIEEDGPSIGSFLPGGSETPAGAAKKGSLDKDIIRRIVRAHLDEVRDCYNQGLARDPALTGRVEIQFTIAAGGEVAEAHVQDSTLPAGADAVADCVAAAVATWKFPRPEGGGNVVVTYPFVLEPG